MASITKLPGTMQGWTGLVSGSNTWSFPDNAKIANEGTSSMYTTVNVGGDFTVGAQYSVYLYFRNFGFGASIGSGATINGIQVDISGHSTNASNCTVTTLQLASNTSTKIGNNKAAANVIPTSDSTLTYGGSTDVWGATLSQAIVTASDFGFVLEVRSTDSVTQQTVSIDYGQMTIWWTGGAATGVSAGVAGNVIQWNSGKPSNLAF